MLKNDHHNNFSCTSYIFAYAQIINYHYFTLLNDRPNMHSGKWVEKKEKKK